MKKFYVKAQEPANSFNKVISKGQGGAMGKVREVEYLGTLVFKDWETKTDKRSTGAGNRRLTEEAHHQGVGGNKLGMICVRNPNKRYRTIGGTKGIRIGTGTTKHRDRERRAKEKKLLV